MSKQRSPIPAYRLHKQSGQAIVTLRDATTGQRRDILLGPHGTENSLKEYHRVVSEWQQASKTLIVTDARRPPDLTMNELCLAYALHAERYHLKDGKPTNHARRIKTALRPVKELYGHTIAQEFRPLSLRTVRDRYLCHTCAFCRGTGRLPVLLLPDQGEPDYKKCGRCKGNGVKGYVRRNVNQLTDCVRAMFKWAVAEELVPETVYTALMAVDGLRRGKVQAREHLDVKPVPLETVNRTLPHLSLHVKDMVRIQMLTGARSGEVCDLRPEQIEQIAPVWVWRPLRHKNEHRGKDRVIAVGPQAQAILRPLLEGLRADEPVFSPRRAREERYRRLRAARKSRVQPSQTDRKTKQPKKRPREQYTAETYAKSIADTCARRGLPHWHPHQLRHTHGTEVRKRFGLEGAQIALGHATADVTQIYAQRDMELAARIAQAMG